jgi:hypothetical protein
MFEGAEVDMQLLEGHARPERLGYRHHLHSELDLTEDFF